jgi:hypothetical protein
VIAEELPISHAARSHEAVMAPGHHGKVILVPRGAADGALHSNGAMLAASRLKLFNGYRVRRPEM